MSALPPGLNMEETLAALEQLTISRYISGVALVLSLYDWMLLFGDESLTIWKTRWTLPKAIYYFNRIVTPLGMALAVYHLSDIRTTVLSTQFCTGYTYTISLTAVISFFLCNWLLTLRLVALYKRKRWVVWFLYTFLIVSYTATGALMLHSLRQFGLTIHYSELVHVCASTTRSALMPAIFFVPAAFEFTIFLMTGYRAFHDAKNITSTSNAPFLTVLYRDGCVCFFVMFGARIWNIWIYATQPLTSAYLGVYLFWSIMAILSTRVYLNLVYLARKPIVGGQEEVSRVQFGAGGGGQTTGGGKGRPAWGGIQMRVQTTTFVDGGADMLSFGSQEASPTRPAMPKGKFDSLVQASGLDHTSVKRDEGWEWDEAARKHASANGSANGWSSHPPSRRHSSHRPFSTLSFVPQPAPSRGGQV